MEIIWTKTKSIATLAALAALGAGFLVKSIYFPAVDERFFQLDSQRLQNAPANVLIVRPTRHGASNRSGFVSVSKSYESGQYKPRFVGRNVTVAQMIAAAYQCQPARVHLPYGMPTNHFDVLDTLNHQPAERLQRIIKDKFGYVASWQQLETDVLSLKVSAPGAPGLRASTADHGNVRFENGRLMFTHMGLARLAGFAENALKKPVQDQTGLPGFYDYSIPWSWRGFDGMDPTKLKAALTDLGLSLDDDTASMKMMVVEHTR